MGWPELKRNTNKKKMFIVIRITKKKAKLQTSLSTSSATNTWNCTTWIVTKKKIISVTKDKVRDRWRNKSLLTLPWEVLGLERKLSHPRKSPWETSAGEASVGVSQAVPRTGGDALARAPQMSSSGNTTKTSVHLQWIIISFAFTREWNQLPAMAACVFLRWAP